MEVPKSNGFRADINGLRAWAVVAVILYHFGVPGFSGGFVGVDVFFVISGFLMTGIIFKGLNNNNHNPASFSLLSFYLARAKRIIPALLTLCAALLILGWFLLPATEYAQLGKHSFGAASFISNVMFWQEAGYFDADSHDKWLLHTWSLSVEWQFYIILPLVLMAIWKIRPHKNTLIAAYCLGVLASLTLSILITNLKPSAAFYLLPTRAWEMLAGGLILLIQNSFTQNRIYLKAFELLGFTFIITSIAIFDSQTLWPSWKAILPVVGTCLVIIAKQRKSLLSTTKAHSILGKWSYSLYLWHWPLVVFLFYANEQDNYLWVTTALMATLILGYVSFKYIETPSANFLTRVKKTTSTVGTILASATILSIGIYVNTHEGIHGRIPAYIDVVFDEKNSTNPRKKECIGTKTKLPEECTYGGNTLGIIVLGDSHAATLVRAIEKSLPSKDTHVLDWTMSACPTILGMNRKNHPRCKIFNDYAFNKQKTIDRSTPIIIINRNANLYYGKNEDFSINPKTEYYFEGASNENYQEIVTTKYIETLCNYAEERPVFVIRPIPELIQNVPKIMGRNLLLDDNKEVKITMGEYHSRQEITWDAQDIAFDKCGVNILDPTPYFCDSEYCYGAKDGMPIYYDDDHLSLRGADLLIPMFQQIFKQNNIMANES